jgi:flavodoxin
MCWERAEIRLTDALEDMMRALVVYESMYGNTHAVASAVAEGLRPSYEVDVVPVGEAAPDALAAADLLVVGGPTHIHGMSRPASRKMAVDASRQPQGPPLDAAAQGPGVREWLDALATATGSIAAAFDTRLRGMPFFTGRAGLGIARKLRRHGFRLAVAPESFIVDKQNHLTPEELHRAARWGRRLAETADTNADADTGANAHAGTDAGDREGPAGDTSS